MIRVLDLRRTSIERINTRIHSMTEIEQIKVDVLNISMCNLKEIPESVRLLKNLNTIYMFANQLTSVPPWLEELPLRYIDLYSNAIKRLPSWNMPRLKHLCISENLLQKLPYVIRDYPLKILNLNRNRFPIEGIVFYYGFDRIARALDRLDNAGCLTRPLWTKETHKYVPDEKHIETKVSMLVLNRLGNQVFPRGIKTLICSLVNTDDNIKRIKR